jgi:transposase
MVPAKVFVWEIHRKKYCCPICSEGVKTAPAEPAIIPKSMATPELLTQIIVWKFVDHLPLYRQEFMFERIGILLERRTMANWCIKVAGALTPIYNILQDLLLMKKYLQMDETTLQVLNEEEKKATSKSYMWVRFAPGINPIVLFDYAPGRGGKVPLELLEGFKGTLQVDGYDGYNESCNAYQLIRLGCNDHARRKFFDAFKSNSNKSIGKRGIGFYKDLYKIEERIKNLSPAERKAVRQAEAKPIMEEFKKWLDSKRGSVTPKSLGGKAISYTLNEWPYLTGYLDNGEVEISNILVENKIRPFALGRKNWLFSASVEGAKSTGILFSLIETAIANEINPFDYLRQVIEKVPHCKTVEDYEKLLPFKNIFIG